MVKKFEEFINEGNLFSKTEDDVIFDKIFKKIKNEFDYDKLNGYASSKSYKLNDKTTLKINNGFISLNDVPLKIDVKKSRKLVTFLQSKLDNKAEEEKKLKQAKEEKARISKLKDIEI